jgi:hypothetical protein
MTKAFETALALIQAEEIGRNIKVEITPEPKPATYVDRRSGVTLPINLFDKSGSGSLKELVVKSTDSGYKVIINADGVELYNNDWSWFNSMTQEVKEFSAFQDESGIYVLSITDIKFTRNLKVSLRPTGIRTMELRVNEIFLKVEIKEG